MKLQEIPKRLGMNDSQFADSIDLKRQNFYTYKKGLRGVANSIEARIMITHDLSREVVFFRPAFHLHNMDNPQYWASLALEALVKVKELGVETHDIEQLIIERIAPLEDEFEASNLEQI